MRSKLEQQLQASLDRLNEREARIRTAERRVIEAAEKWVDARGEYGPMMQACDNLHAAVRVLREARSK